MTGTKEKTVKCSQCQSEMKLVKGKRFNGMWPLAIVIAGIVLLLIGGFLHGVPLLLLGVYLMAAERTVSCCAECGYFFEVYG